jgi:hypothetical protein
MKRRRYPDGSITPVHVNRGLRKICGCARRRWSSCEHSWHFNFTWQGRTHRFSLDRFTGRHVERPV